MGDAYFGDGGARSTLKTLADQPDGVLFCTVHLHTLSLAAASLGRSKSSRSSFYKSSH